MVLDESWLNEGLERLSTVRMLTGTVSALRTADKPLYAQIAALESCWYMRNQLLRDTDWSSMAHGLEVRSPLLDIDTFLDPPAAPAPLTLDQSVMGRDAVLRDPPALRQ